MWCAGKARMRWGEKLEFVAEAGPGDFIYVPPFVPHQEINASRDEPLECVLVRSDGEAVVVNLDIEPVEKPEAVPGSTRSTKSDAARFPYSAAILAGCCPAWSSACLRSAMMSSGCSIPTESRT